MLITCCCRCSVSACSAPDVAQRVNEYWGLNYQQRAKTASTYVSSIQTRCAVPRCVLCYAALYFVLAAALAS